MGPPILHPASDQCSCGGTGHSPSLPTAAPWSLGDLGTEVIHPEPHALGDTLSSKSVRRKPHPDSTCPPLSAPGLPSPYFRRGPTASTISGSGTLSSSAMPATSSPMALSLGTQPMWNSQRYVPPWPPPGL